MSPSDAPPAAAIPPLALAVLEESYAELPRSTRGLFPVGQSAVGGERTVFASEHGLTESLALAADVVNDIARGDTLTPYVVTYVAPLDRGGIKTDALYAVLYDPDAPQVRTFAQRFQPTYLLQKRKRIGEPFELPGSWTAPAPPR